MYLFEKKSLEWREPKAFVRIRDAHEQSLSRWWQKPLYVAVGMGILIGLWGFAHLLPDRRPQPFYVLLLGGLPVCLFLAYVPSWVNRHSPSTIGFFKTELVLVRGDFMRRVKYADIESFDIEEANERFAVLVLKSRKREREILIGMHAEMPRDRVLQIFFDHQVPQRLMVER